VELRYIGFDQKKNTRAYRFKGVIDGEAPAFFVVTADLALFLTHRIGIQEGPGLCVHKLAADLQNSVSGDHELTNDDLLAHANARALAGALKAARKTGPRRRPAVEGGSRFGVANFH
jgi:hypothetical protein